jgi:hypothetical protein
LTTSMALKPTSYIICGWMIISQYGAINNQK